MTPEREEWLFDAISHTGKIVRCTIETIETTAFGGKTASQVTIDVERQAAASDDVPSKLSMSAVFPTEGMTIEEIREISFDKARKLLDHSRPGAKGPPA